MLEQLIGCRLESVRLSKTAWLLEFEGAGVPRSHYSVSTSAEVSCEGSVSDAQPTYEFIQGILEDDLVDARYDPDNRTVTLWFRQGSRLAFCNREYAGGDNSAIITNLANGEWELLA